MLCDVDGPLCIQPQMFANGQLLSLFRSNFCNWLCSGKVILIDIWMCFLHRTSPENEVSSDSTGPSENNTTDCCRTECLVRQHNRRLFVGHYHSAHWATLTAFPVRFYLEKSVFLVFSLNSRSLPDEPCSDLTHGNAGSLWGVGDVVLVVMEAKAFQVADAVLGFAGPPVAGSNDDRNFLQIVTTGHSASL